MTNLKACPRVVVFAGPNGAGKSTHAEAILASLGIATFVNADYIARGLSGGNTEAVAFQAGRIMLRRLRQLGQMREDFAFESTLASLSFAPFLRGLKADGYRVAIHYFALASPFLAVRRVKLRVAMGGHDVPTDVVRRRFGRSVVNFFGLYLPLANEWSVYDNSTNLAAVLVAEFDGAETTVKRAKTWQMLQSLKNAA